MTSGLFGFDSAFMATVRDKFRGAWKQEKPQDLIQPNAIRYSCALTKHAAHDPKPLNLKP